MSKVNIHTRDTTKNLTTAAVCLALCMVLPFLTGQIPQIGQALSPMHIPVLLCGFITGPAYAMIVGLIAPLLRFFLFGMPAPFMAIPMCFELAAYGLLTGLLHRAFPKRTPYVYATLILSMLLGRFVWGLAMWRVTATGFFELPPFIYPFTWEVFIAQAFTLAVPGIILHIVLIPLIVMSFRKAGIVD